MGIPVWEFRSSDVIQDAVSEPLSEELLEQLLHCHCWVLTDRIDSEEMHRLLHAMLFSIDLDASKFAIFHPEHIAEVSQLDPAKKVILILGKQIADIDESLADKFESVESHSLMDLLKQPELKSKAWTDLQWVKKTLVIC